MAPGSSVSSAQRRGRHLQRLKGRWLRQLFHTIANNDCRRNKFWGWQSDVWNGSQLFDTTVTGNDFDSNRLALHC